MARTPRTRKEEPRTGFEKPVTLIDYTRTNLKNYGYSVVQQRAVPDYRDGLKPVQRSILWAMYKLGLSPAGRYTKCARVVGDTIGKYNPHGDGSAYQALVNLTGVRAEDDPNVWIVTNSPEPLIDGYGSFGDNISSAAAYRYTECRLSKFAWNAMLDPAYLAVSDYLKNFSGDELVPLVLPAKLPIMLLIGSVSIAFGVSADCPSFSKDSVKKLVTLQLEGTKVSPKLCLKHLQFKFPYGGECISSQDDILRFYTDGKASLQFRPTMEVNEAKKSITVTSYCPGMTSQNVVDKTAAALREMDGVLRVANATDKHGFKLEIQASRSIRVQDFENFVAAVQKELVFRYSFDLGISTRKEKNLTDDQLGDSVEFNRISVPKLIAKWCDWRVELELKMLKHLLEKHEQELARLKLLVLAVDHLKIIMDSLRVDDSETYLQEKLKITREQATYILDMRVRQLKALEKTKLQTLIKEANEKIKSVKSDLRDPKSRIIRDLKTV